MRGRRRDEGAAARDPFQQTFLGEALDGLARGHPADGELLAELGVRGQRVARLELDDAGPKRLLDLVVAGDEGAHASTAQRSGRWSGAPRRPRSSSVRCQRPRFAATTRSSSRADEADVRRRAENRSLRILRDDIEAAVAVEVVDAVRPVAADQQAPAGGEGEAVEDGAVDPEDRLALAGLEVETRQPRLVRLDEPEPAAVRGDGEAVREARAVAGDRLLAAVDVDPNDAAVVAVPGSRVGDVERAVGRERRIVGEDEVAAEPVEPTAVERVDTRGLAADHDAAAAVDREPEHEPRRAGHLRPGAFLELDAVDLARLAARPDTTALRIPGDTLRVVEAEDQRLNPAHARPSRRSSARRRRRAPGR